MFLQNDLLEYAEPNAKLVRILWRHPESSVVIIIEVDSVNDMPKLTRIEALKADLDSGKAKLLTNEISLATFRWDGLFVSGVVEASRYRLYN